MTSPNHVVRLTGPAPRWIRALPLGNGRIGVMCFADPRADRFALNDDRCWSGGPESEFTGGPITAVEAREAMSAARDAIRARAYSDADRAVQRLQQRYTQAFLPLGDLIIRWSNLPEIDAVERTLDLRTAVHQLVARSAGHTVLERRTIVSAPDQVMIVHSRFAAPADVTLCLTTPLRPARYVRDGEDLELTIVVPADVAPTHENVPAPVSYAQDRPPTAGIVLRIGHDGRVADTTSDITVSGVRQLTTVLSTASTFTALGAIPMPTLDEALQGARSRVHAGLGRGWGSLLETHLQDHARLYDRCSVNFGAAETPRQPADDRTLNDGDDGEVLQDTAERLRAARRGESAMATDPALVALLFHFSRYLLIASSRSGTLPANLQGIWNDALPPPWSSNFTLNINTEMNYWAAESTGLAECHEPLFDLMEALADNGTAVASRLYAAPGWAAHHNTDAWAYASPVGRGAGNPSWAFWPMAGFWLTRHVAEHLAHGADPAFARRMYKVVRGAAEFGLSLLDELAPGQLGPLVSTSPENEFRTDHASAAVARASTMDIELLADTFRTLIGMAELIGVRDDPVVVAGGRMLGLLAPVRVGADGGIREWYDDLVAVDPHHRHVSMLYGLYPGDRMLDPEELAAASRSLDLRGDDSTGWSIVWKAALRARLGEPERVQALLNLLLRAASDDRGPWSGGLYDNLFSSAPPFQIDANLGFPAVIAECLVQSHHGVIHLLPALPSALAHGRARGLVARPGVTVDLAWQDGALTRATLRSEIHRSVSVRYGRTIRDIVLDPREDHQFEYASAGSGNDR